MAQTGMYMKDGHVLATWKYGDMSLRDDGLVVSRHDLAEQVTFISASGTQHLDVSLGDPRVIVDREYREALYQILQSEEHSPSPSCYDADLSPLRECPQLVSLVLCGNLLHSEVLTELPNLRRLSLDNTLGKSRVDLSALPLHTLYIQKPGRNVTGFEHISTLQELTIWNYHPRSRDLTELSRLTSLRRLQLIQPRITTLDGLGHLHTLERLEVHYASTLTDASAIKRCSHPVTVVMEHVPKLADN